MQENQTLSTTTLKTFLQESPTACVVVDQCSQILLCNYKAQRLCPRSSGTLREFIEGVFSASGWGLFFSWLESPERALLMSRSGERGQTFSVTLQQVGEHRAIWLQEVSTVAEQQRLSFSALLSHELRAPLVSIRGYTELVATERIGALNERQKRGLEIALRNIGSLVDLIDNLLLYSRLNNGAGIGKLTRHHMQDALCELLLELREQCAEKKIAFSFEADEAPLYCRLDLLTFNVALRNVLSNALKFTDKGGRISLSLKKVEGRVRLNVLDSGVGISAESLDRIFEPFYQPEGVITRKSRGMGLGLAVSREIVMQHGGTLEVSSNPANGSCFTLSLPVSE